MANEQREIMSEAAALTDIGEAYYLGIGMERNYAEAFRYYKKAADMGSVFALCRLGICYESGLGTEKDMEKAMDCFEEAASSGNAVALYRLGDFYYNGVEGLVQRDVIRAADYYLNAMISAELVSDYWNLPDIYLRIARCMESGNGIEKSLPDAYDFYVSAINGYLDRADEGDVACEESLDYAETHADRLEKILRIERQPGTD